MKNSYSHIIKDLKDNKLIFHIGNTTCPGTFVCEAYHSDIPHPLGIVWYNWVGNSTIQINNSYVCEEVRRNGLRTLVHKFLIRSFPHCRQILTAQGNKMSTPWLRKTGFKRNKNKDWVLNIKR